MTGRHEATHNHGFIVNSDSATAQPLPREGAGIVPRTVTLLTTQACHFCEEAHTHPAPGGTHMPAPAPTRPGWGQGCPRRTGR